jgi:hypothetical protein
VIEYGLEFIQSFGTTSGLIITFVIRKMKKLEQKAKPLLTEQVQKCGCFQNYPPGKIALVIWFLVESL